MTQKSLFERQNTVGRYGEIEIAVPIFEELGFKCLHVDQINIHERAFYDLAIRKRTSKRYFKVEVKTDIMSSLTGNLLIECKQNGKDSGLTITKAELWAHIAGGSMYLFKTKDLKKYCANHKTAFYYNENGTPMEGYLVDIWRLTKKVKHKEFLISRIKREEIVELWEEQSGKRFPKRRL